MFPRLFCGGNQATRGLPYTGRFDWQGMFAISQLSFKWAISSESLERTRCFSPIAQTPQRPSDDAKYGVWVDDVARLAIGNECVLQLSSRSTSIPLISVSC